MEYKFINADRNVVKEDIPEIKEWIKHENINQLIPEQNHTLLEYAVMGGVLEVTKFLLENGADPTAVDNDGHTCLQHARHHGGNRKLEKLILEAIKNYTK